MASMHVGSCHATRVPGPMPVEARCAATPDDRARYSANVMVRSCSSTASTVSGHASALDSISDHHVVEASASGMQVAVEEQVAALVGDLVDGVAARHPQPANTHPDRVAHEVVD